MVTEMDFVTGIWEVGLSPVTHMNLFWVKDLRLGKCHLYKKYGWHLGLINFRNTQ